MALNRLGVWLLVLESVFSCLASMESSVLGHDLMAYSHDNDEEMGFDVLALIVLLSSHYRVLQCFLLRFMVLSLSRVQVEPRYRIGLNTSICNFLSQV